MLILSKVEKYKLLGISQDFKITGLYDMLQAKENEDIYRKAQASSIIFFLSFKTKVIAGNQQHPISKGIHI